MPLDGSDTNTSNENEFSVTETQMNALLDSGDLMLANHWEEHDFVTRLEVETVYDEEDDAYNHDDDINNNSMDETSKNATIPSDQPPRNLIHLTHLHEPSVVHALRHRYQNSYDEFISLQNNNACGIYTDTGPILLAAVNPFKSDDKGILYGKETKEKYRDEGERRWQRGESGDGDQENGSSLPPHVYAVADRTFRTMVTRMYHKDFDYSCKRSQHSTPNDNQQTKREKTNQSVLVSGESGAGKTVTTKLLMGYLAELSERPQENTKLSVNMSIERRVLESNPIMESFGNARTVRNDNSSRFGKYIEMNFSSTPFSSPTNQTEEAKISLVGASVETYLLEKVRLVHQSIGERNYHIFYELFSLKRGVDSYVQDGNDNIHDKVEIEGNDETSQIANESNASLVDKFGLLNYDMEDFRMISNSDTYDRRDGVSDFDTFRDLKRAMNIMGFTKPEQNAVLGVTAALLHASNVTFHEIGEVECALDMDNPHLSYLVDLLGITKEDLNKALCYYEIVVGRGASGEENHFRELSQSQAEKGVEALIKATYGALFQYLVGRINASISGSDTTDGNVSNRGHGKSSNVGRKSRDSNKKEASIGILDIFGFESFEVNSFEQLCINYCNEALQQQFNRFVLRNEQEEYHREGISWSFIEFPENQDVLELIDSKGSGILNILHDQCRTPGASDKTFALSLYDKCSSHSRFEADSRQVAQQLFAVNHYAGSVEYNVEGFVEKNRDELPKEATDLLLSSKNEFVQTLAKILQPENTQPSAAGSSKSTRPGPSKGASNRPTVGIQFSSQLHSLRQKIDDTSPHYIRCLKPNNELVPNVFDSALIANQLRCAGVIEALRVSRLGYPQRYSHQQFLSRYRMLGVKVLRKMKAIPSAKALVLAITDDLSSGSYNDEAIGIEVGKTKIFLVQKAYDKLEKLRRDKISSSAIAIQKSVRRLVYQKRYQSLCRSALMIQCHLRRVQSTKVVRAMRREYSSVIIQNLGRGHIARKQFLSAKAIASWCQALYRGKLDRVRYNKIRRNSKALHLQSCWRRYVAARAFQGQLASVLILQCSWRSKIARNEFRKLKLEARNFQVVVQERDRLREELSSLRNAKTSLPSQQYSISQQHLVEKEDEINSLRKEMEKVLREKEAVENELKDAKNSASSFQSEKDILIDERDRLFAENEQLRNIIHSHLDLSTLERATVDNKVRVSLMVGKKHSLKTALSEIDNLMLANLVMSKENIELREELRSLHCDSTPAKLPYTNKENKDVDDPFPSVCTSLTVDMTEIEDEPSKLRDDNRRLRKELSLLRSNYEDLTKELDCSDHEYGNESYIPEGDDNESGTEYIGEAGSERLKIQANSITSGRCSPDAKINKLKDEIKDMQSQMERIKKMSSYDLDDMRRINRSLREDLEEAIEAKSEIFNELETKCEEIDALNEDIEKFAETFAEQSSELERVERKNNKLQLEVKRLKIENAEKSLKISELEADRKNWVGSEIEKLWSEIDSIRDIGTPAASVRSDVPNSHQNKELFHFDSLDSEVSAHDEVCGLISPSPSKHCTSKDDL